MAQPLRVLGHQQVSQQAQRIAGAYQLGEVKSEYRFGHMHKQMFAWIGILWGVALLFGAFAIIPFFDPKQGFDAPGSFQQFAWTGAALLAFGCGCWFLRIPILQRNWHIYLCAEGFACVKNGQAEVFRWDQITTMWHNVTALYQNGIYVRTRHIYTVQRLDQVQIVLDDTIANVENLADSITEVLVERMLPKVLEAFFVEGKTLNFGPISISPQGFSNGKELLSWDRIDGINLDGGTLSISKQGKFFNWADIDIPTIPNAFLLVGLFQAMIHLAHAQEEGEAE